MVYKALVMLTLDTSRKIGVRVGDKLLEESDIGGTIYEAEPVL